jgi:hypothetical protein
MMMLKKDVSEFFSLSFRDRDCRTQVTQMETHGCVSLYLIPSLDVSNIVYFAVEYRQSYDACVFRS